MRIAPNLYIVGSGSMGLDLTDPYDCNIYLFDSGDSYILFDAGAGIDIDPILSVCLDDGIDITRIKHLFLTHAHADHAGGAAFLRARLGLKTYAYSDTAKMVAAGDQEATSLSVAREAGVYPGNYVYQACPIDKQLVDKEVVNIGNAQIEAISTPGHSHDHCCYLVEIFENSYMISGDAIFFGGKVIWQNIYDCNVPETNSSIQCLATYSFEALLPGHLNFSLKGGKRHINSACEVIHKLGCPDSII